MQCPCPGHKSSQLLLAAVYATCDTPARLALIMCTVTQPPCAGYFDAPCAYLCPLSYESLIPLPSVTLLFCVVQGVDEMKVGPSRRPSGRACCAEAYEAAHAVARLPFALDESLCKAYPE